MVTEMNVAPLQRFEIPAEKVKEFYQRAGSAQTSMLQYYYLWVWIAEMFPPAWAGNFHCNYENIMHPFVVENDPTPHNPMTEFLEAMGGHG